ncbi:MAG: glycosyltransferase family 2 protein [Actinomycetota bacterium]
MIDHPLVSVVIPTYNRGVRLLRAVGSALGQTHAAIEVVVVDDGSTDGTGALLAERFGGDDRVRCLIRPNGGPAAARNTGLAAARGDFVAFLDSDDEWLPWKLGFELACLDRLPAAGMVWSDMGAVDPDGRLIADRYLRTMYRHYADIRLPAVFTGSITLPGGAAPGSPAARVWHGDLFTAMLGGNLVHTSTVLLRADRAEAVGGFDESLTLTGEDFDFHLRTCRLGPVAFADVPTTIYRVGAPDQLTLREHMVPMAANYLRTVEKAVSAGSPVSDTDRRAALGAAHAWLGEELLAAGDRAAARSHLRAGLRGPRRTRSLALLLLATVPSALAGPLRRVLAWIRRLSRVPGGDRG